MAGENAVTSVGGDTGGVASTTSSTQTFDDAVKAQSAATTAASTDAIPTDKLVKVGAAIAASVILPLIFNTIKYAKEAMEGFDE
jgi:hypothetical protein